MTREVTVTTKQGKFQQDVVVGEHRLVADEPVAAGGEDAGPTPHEWLLAALGACTSMTVKMYADRKGWPLRHVEVKLTGERTTEGYAIKRVCRFEGDLDDEQRARLVEIAEKCPVHKTLSGKIAIATSGEVEQ